MRTTRVLLGAVTIWAKTPRKGQNNKLSKPEHEIAWKKQLCRGCDAVSLTLYTLCVPLLGPTRMQQRSASGSWPSRASRVSSSLKLAPCGASQQARQACEVSRRHRSGQDTRLHMDRHGGIKMISSHKFGANCSVWHNVGIQLSCTSLFWTTK